MIEKLKQQLHEESLTKYALSAVIIFVIVCVLEVTVFNYRHWESIGNNPEQLNYCLSANLAAIDGNTFEVMSTDEQPYIEVTGINSNVQNVMADFTFPDEGVYAVKRIDYYFAIIDDGHSQEYYTPTTSFMHLVPQSFYKHLNPYGKVHSFRICFENLDVGNRVRVEFLNLNVKVPMMPSKKRVLALTIFLFILFCLRPKSIIHTVKITSNSRLKVVCIVAMFVFELAFTHWAIHLNRAFIDPQSNSERQYMLLAEALSQGETHLLIDPPQGLKDMVDPYDYDARISACVGQEEPLWDTAYHDGKYYVYFGVAPILVYYLPYYLITGTHVVTRNIVYINIVLAFIGFIFLFYEMSKRWFKDLSLGVFIMFNMMCTFGCGLVFLIMKPDFYGVPLSMAVALCIWGLFLWLYSIREDRIIPWAVCLGSMCLALEAATRPQFLLASFLSLLIFWNAVFKDRTLLSKKSIASTISFIAPYVVVAAGVMYYNYDRFGSVFDFGANYNLTFNNMPYRGFHLDRLFHSTVGYLFYPCSVSNMFPYFDRCTYLSTYMGETADEALFGGLIYNNIILLPALAGFKFRKYITDIRKYIYVCIAPVVALFVAFVDGNMAGVLTRYYCDFAWYIFIAMFIILCSVLANDIGDKDRNRIISIVWVCFLVFLVRLFLDQFAGDANPASNLILKWQQAKYLVEFWH